MNSFDYAGVVFTLTNADVDNVYKGEHTEDKINILETGGIYEKINYAFEGNEVFKLLTVVRLGETDHE